jgi:hypothetical protein
MTESKDPGYEKQFSPKLDEAFDALKQARYAGKGLSDPIKTVEVDLTERMLRLIYASLIMSNFLAFRTSGSYCLLS